MRNSALTLARLVPSALLLLPVAPVGCIDREDPEERGATGRLVPTPTAGEMERGGTFGGGPGSAPGDRRCELRERFISVCAPSVVYRLSSILWRWRFPGSPWSGRLLMPNRIQITDARNLKRALDPISGGWGGK